MTKQNITPENITSLKENEVFVFGSNLSGIHGGGAALTAVKWGAKKGKGVGLFGQTYALPTKSKNIERSLTIEEIKPYADEFISFAVANPQLHFLLTEVGCGLAGIKHEDISPLFKPALMVTNISMPQKFIDVLNAQMIVKGYKVADKNNKCRGHLFEVGKEYRHSGPISICNSGFHFCTIPAHCFSYYEFNSENKVFEVESYGKTDAQGDDSKVCTGHLKIIRQLDWNEVLTICNIGVGNTGHSNAGNRNAGYDNAGNDNAGIFNTQEAPYMMFNKPSKWKFEDLQQTKAFNLLNNIDTTMWVPSSVMSEEEKVAYPYHVTTQGYVKYISFKEAFQNSWHNWSEENRKEFMSLPNFSKTVFEEITGVKIK